MGRIDGRYLHRSARFIVGNAILIFTPNYAGTPQPVFLQSRCKIENQLVAWGEV